MREVDVEQFAAERREDVAVVDVRSPEEFVSGHVPGAVNVPLERVVADAARYAGQKLYVICQSGGRSLKVAQALAAAGAQPVSVAGGTKGWITSGRAVDTGTR
jgi:rhodanese-related sulfurtransferase